MKTLKRRFYYLKKVKFSGKCRRHPRNNSSCWSGEDILGNVPIRTWTLGASANDLNCYINTRNIAKRQIRNDLQAENYMFSKRAFSPAHRNGISFRKYFFPQDSKIYFRTCHLPTFQFSLTRSHKYFKD